MVAKRVTKMSNGRHAIIIHDNAEFSDFINFINHIETKLNVSFKEKIDDFDTHYWGFSYLDTAFILYYNIYEGIKIYLHKEKNEEDVSKLMSLFLLLK